MIQNCLAGQVLMYFYKDATSSTLLSHFSREKMLGTDHPDTCLSQRFYNVMKQWDAS